MYGGANETLLPYGVLGRHSLVSELQSRDKRGSILRGKAYGQWKNFSGPKSHKAPRCTAMSTIGER